MAAIDKAEPAPITLTVTTGVDHQLVVSIAGELDMSNVDVVRRQLDTLLDAIPSSIVFELGELTFMDSSGIAFLVQVAARIKAISLRNVPGLIRRVLEATGVTELLTIEP
jgi:anti-anti-sigma factor